MKTINKLLKKLPPYLFQEVEDFILFLIEKNKIRRKKKLKLTLRGALKDLKKKYTSVELQHKSLEWFND